MTLTCDYSVFLFSFANSFWTLKNTSYMGAGNCLAVIASPVSRITTQQSSGDVCL